MLRYMSSAIVFTHLNDIYQLNTNLPQQYCIISIRKSVFYSRLFEYHSSLLFTKIKTKLKTSIKRMYLEKKKTSQKDLLSFRLFYYLRLQKYNTDTRSIKYYWLMITLQNNALLSSTWLVSCKLRLYTYRLYLFYTMFIGVFMINKIWKKKNMSVTKLLLLL